MNAGLLFYLAHRTSQCQKITERYLGYFDLHIDRVKICARKDDLRAAMSQLVASLPLTVIVSDSPQSQPEAAAPLFRILRVPLDANGEPKGVMRLEGTEHTGYLIESINQAIVVLPDIPQEILQMLPPRLPKAEREVCPERAGSRGTGPQLRGACGKIVWSKVALTEKALCLRGLYEICYFLL